MKINDVKVGVEYAYQPWSNYFAGTLKVTEIVTVPEKVRQPYYYWQSAVPKYRNVRKVKGIYLAKGEVGPGTEKVVLAKQLSGLQPMLDRQAVKDRREDLAKALAKVVSASLVSADSYGDRGFINVRLTEDEARVLLDRLT